MELTSVKSSNVQAIGYIAEIELLIVLYRDGAVYARPGITEQAHRDLMASESIGKFLHGLRDRAVLLSGEGRIEPVRLNFGDEMKRVKGAAVPLPNCDFGVL